MTKKFFKSLFLLALLFIVSGFSDIKQKDEYSCAPVCAANCIINYNSFKNNESELIKYFSKTAKTSEKGTKTNNLCKALEKYFKQNKRSVIIQYDGIRPVDKRFKSKNHLNVFNELQSGKSVILNIGVYKFDGTTYKRIYGHYVNAININEKGQILITDPYEKAKAFYIDLKDINTPAIQHNKDDNEKVIKNDFNYKEVTGLPYLKQDERALLNGIISINLLVF